MKLILVATGETILDKQDRTQGWSDSPLTQSGIQYASLVKEKLSKISIGKAYCSSSERAIDTAEIIIENRNIELNVDRRLKDINYGTFEATPYYIKDTYYKHSNTTRLDFSEAGGENINQFTLRLRDVMNKIICDSNCDERILIVTHQFVIETLLNIYALKSGENIKYIVENNNIVYLIYKDDRYILEVESCI